MSIHVCACVHGGRQEFHLRYPGMDEQAAQLLADRINAGHLAPMFLASSMAEKTARNIRVQARYDELMQEGRHGHYETIFRIVREELERAATANPSHSQDTAHHRKDRSMTPTYIEVSAGVRYWEDATINGTDDESGSLTPFRKEDNWCPVIRLADGVVMDWPVGTEADIHFKVCDDGDYWLLDADRKRIAKWGGYYVPDDFLCPGDNGYGDYIILKIDGEGRIAKWREPAIDWASSDEDQQGWARLPAAVAA